VPRGWGETPVDGNPHIAVATWRPGNDLLEKICSKAPPMLQALNQKGKTTRYVKRVWLGLPHKQFHQVAVPQIKIIQILLGEFDKWIQD
jgi:hypothetical protein